MRVSYLLVFFFIVIFSCTTEPAEITYSNKKIPVSIAKNFTMTYTDSMLTKSFVSGKIHYDFTNDLLNYSEFYEENNFEYIDKTNRIIANRLDSNRDFTDLVTGNLTGSINITEE